MRVAVLVKGSAESEAGEMPSEAALSEMTDFNEELVKAGVMLAGEGLHPSSRGVRVAYSGADRQVIEGPFEQPDQLVAGYWLWQVESLDEAIDWAKRAPFQEGDVEIRPVFETDDFGDELTPELREREARMREQTEAKQ